MRQLRLGFVELTDPFLAIDLDGQGFHYPLLIKSSVASFFMLLPFFAGVPMTTVAIGAASYLLITRRVRPEKVYSLVDWRLLVFFIGLFIVVEGVERSGLVMATLETVGRRTAGHPIFLVAVSGCLTSQGRNQLRSSRRRRG